MNIVIPLAGAGSRFSKTHSMPKPLIPVDGKLMIQRAIESLGFDGIYHFVVRDDEYLPQTTWAIKQCVDPIMVKIDHLTEGPASSALLLREYINDDELIIANCDQIMKWDCEKALDEMRKYDGAVVTINSSDPKHSYVRVKEGIAVEFAEKKVISNTALTGIHYWKNGQDFVSSADQMIAENNRTRNEFYIAPTYNYMKKPIGVYMVTDKEYYPIGTPSDLEAYESR